MTKSTGVGRGGARVGAGRKASDGAQWVVRVDAYLDQESADVVESLGGGSIGVRRAIAELLMYRGGGLVSRNTTQAVPTRALQSIAKPRGILRTPTKVEEELPIDPRAVYD